MYRKNNWAPTARVNRNVRARRNNELDVVGRWTRRNTFAVPYVVGRNDASRFLGRELRNAKSNADHGHIVPTPPVRKKKTRANQLTYGTAGLRRRYNARPGETSARRLKTLRSNYAPRCASENFEKRKQR